MPTILSLSLTLFLPFPFCGLELNLLRGRRIGGGGGGCLSVVRQGVVPNGDAPWTSYRDAAVARESKVKERKRSGGRVGWGWMSWLGGIQTSCQELPSGFFRWGLLCLSSNWAAAYALAAQREWSERAAILLHWPQSPSSSQSIPLSRPLSFCQLLSAPQSAFQCTSFGKIEVAIQSLTFPHSLFSPPLNSFLTQ